MCYVVRVHVVGVDENGLGPRLGPLIATAATIEVKRYDREKLAALASEAGIGDSKQTSAFGKMAEAESLVLAVFEDAEQRAPTHFDDLLEGMALDGPLILRNRCPGGQTESQCWSAAMPLPAFGGSLERGREMLGSLRKGGVRVKRVRTQIACAAFINDALAAGESKLKVDLGLFERLVLDARRATGHDLTAICGMVGGIRSYQNYFRHFAKPKALRDACAYAVPDVGEVRFEVKADDRHLPVALASMVGKVMRELAMARIVRFYQGHDKSLRDVSGYHDPVTAGFVYSTTKLRKRLRIVGECFER